MSRQRFILSLLSGAVAFGVAELVQTRKILQRLEAEGVTVSLPIIGDEHVTLPQSNGGPSTLQLPNDVTAMQKRMHWVAGGAAAAVIVGVFAVASK